MTLAIQDHYADPILDDAISRDVIIDNRDNSNDLEDYQVQLDIDDDQLTLQGERGIRFVDKNLQVLDYWEEEDLSDWVEVTKIIGSKATAIKMLQKEGMSSASDGDATFDLFDDFEGTLDSNKWTEELKGTGADVNVSGGECELYVPDNQICSANIQSVKNFTNDIIIQVKRKCPNDDEYIGLSLGSGDVCDYAGGSSEWYLTTKHSSYWFSIQLPEGGSLQGIIKMPASGQGTRIGSDFTIDSEDLKNYRTFEYIYDSSGNLKWYIQREDDDIRPLGEGFEKYTGNPLNIPDYGEVSGVVHPDVLYFSDGEDGYKYWMFYETVNGGNVEYLDLVRSNDGINFVDTGVSNHILSPSSGQWDSEAVADVDVVKIGNTWYMYYAGTDGTNNAWGDRKVEIGLATSTDGKNWTKITDGIDGTSKVLEADTSLTDEKRDRLVSPTVIYEDGTFYMWYVSQKEDGHYCVRLAHSTDGKNWTRDGTVMEQGTSGEWDDYIIWHIQVTKYNGVYWMYYMGCADSNEYYAIGLAKSTNRTSWTKSSYNPVLEKSGTGWETTRLYRMSWLQDANGDSVLLDNKMWLYYSALQSGAGYKIGLAKSWEGINMAESELLDSATDTAFLSDNKKILITQGAYSATGRGAPSYLDSVIVRKYTSPDPTAVIE